MMAASKIGKFTFLWFWESLLAFQHLNCELIFSHFQELLMHNDVLLNLFLNANSEKNKFNPLFQRSCFEIKSVLKSIKKNLNYTHITVLIKKFYVNSKIIWSYLVFNICVRINWRKRKTFLVNISHFWCC